MPRLSGIWLLETRDQPILPVPRGVTNLRSFGRARLRTGHVAAVGLAGLVLVALSGAALAGNPPKPGKGLGREKVTICHKGHTITIARPALPAHVRHGDTPAKLTVVKHVVNGNGGTKTAADFTITINGVTAIGGNTFAGSGTGTSRLLSTVGAYIVTETAVLGYHLAGASVDCSGTIALGEQKTCV